MQSNELIKLVTGKTILLLFLFQLGFNLSYGFIHVKGALAIELFDDLQDEEQGDSDDDQSEEDELNMDQFCENHQTKGRFFLKKLFAISWFYRTNVLDTCYKKLFSPPELNV